MPVSQRQKEALLDELLKTQSKAQKLAINLRFRSRNSDARRVQVVNKALGKQIDRLLAQVMREWRTSAAGHLAAIRRTNAGVQKSIREIKKRKRMAQNVVKALGFLDEAIEVASKVARTIVRRAN